jgi:hypothetical protein
VPNLPPSISISAPADRGNRRAARDRSGPQGLSGAAHTSVALGRHTCLLECPTLSEHAGNNAAQVSRSPSRSCHFKRAGACPGRARAHGGGTQAVRGCVEGSGSGRRQQAVRKRAGKACGAAREASARASGALPERRRRRPTRATSMRR